MQSTTRFVRANDTSRAPSMAAATMSSALTSVSASVARRPGPRGPCVPSAFFRPGFRSNRQCQPNAWRAGARRYGQGRMSQQDIDDAMRVWCPLSCHPSNTPRATRPAAADGRICAVLLRSSCVCEPSSSALAPRASASHALFFIVHVLSILGSGVSCIQNAAIGSCRARHLSKDLQLAAGHRRDCVAGCR